MSFEIINGKAYPINTEIYTKKSSSTEKKEIKNKEIHNNTRSFKDILKENIKNAEKIKISKHAKERFEQINFSTEDVKEIEKGLELAKKRGAINPVLIYKDVAIIANIPNDTIITAIEKSRAKDNVYTNIDSVVIL